MLYLLFQGLTTIDLEKTYLRKYRSLENYIPRYREQIQSLFEILKYLRKVSMAPNIMTGEYNEMEIRLLLSYMPELVDKLKTLLSLSEGKFSIRPACLPKELFNGMYMKAYRRLEFESQ